MHPVACNLPNAANWKVHTVGMTPSDLVRVVASLTNSVDTAFKPTSNKKSLFSLWSYR